MAEIFKDIPGYEGYYQVSNLWKVIKLDRHEDMKCRWWWTAKRFRKGWEVYITKSKRRHTTYCMVCLWKEWKVKCIWLHRVVALSFLENPDNKKEVNHKDGDATNNNLSNLEWVTHSENELHKYRVLNRNSTWNKWLKKEDYLSYKKVNKYEPIVKN